jgi:energy-coupling factor transporter ATP-binding protein EcfA2
MQASVIQATNVLVGDLSRSPFSLELARADIVGVLCPDAAPRTSILRVLAGIDAPRSGDVRTSVDPSRVAFVGEGTSLSDRLAMRPDVVVIDGAFDQLEPRLQREAWVRLASERACGTAVIVGTTNAQQAYRSDRVALAMWNREDVVRKFMRLQIEMQDRVSEFMMLVGTAVEDPGQKISRAAELMRLNREARDLTREALRLARTAAELREARNYGVDLVHSSLDDRVLERIVKRLGDA